MLIIDQIIFISFFPNTKLLMKNDRATNKSNTKDRETEKKAIFIFTQIVIQIICILLINFTLSSQRTT